MLSRQKFVSGINEFEAGVGGNSNSFPLFHFPFDCKNNGINANREDCAQHT